MVNLLEMTGCLQEHDLSHSMISKSQYCQSPSMQVAIYPTLNNDDDAQKQYNDHSFPKAVLHFFLLRFSYLFVL